ncbi:MAG: hypothetical protein ABFE13_23975 [Phycisphaerales bacterium]
MQDCVARSPAPWPEAWQREYVDAVRDAILSGRENSQYAKRLQIICDGFGPYWQGLANNRERPAFEVRLAQIRWYVENLMNSPLPGEEERHTLRHQCEDLAEHGAQSSLAQFSFLDPNMVQKAKADWLAECYRNIDAPLLPIFLTPFSNAQIDQIKERWHDLRYARVDLWRQLGGGRTTSPRSVHDTASPETHPDYLLAQRSLSQLRAQIWAVAIPPPDYYHTAVANDLEAQKRKLQMMSEARRQESRLSNAVLQTEYLSFLLGALLETAQQAFSGQTNSHKRGAAHESRGCGRHDEDEQCEKAKPNHQS